MTKVYKIGNKEIVLEDRKSEKYWGAYNNAYARDIHDALVAVLEELDEKKEECKHDSGYTCGSCNTCGESKLVGGGGAGKPDNKCQHGNTYGSGGKYCPCKKEEPKSEETFEQRTARKLDKDILDMLVPRPACMHEISGICIKCNQDVLGSKEPKSTLRESGAKIVYEYLRQSGITFNTIDSKRIADEIISLFKDTLLKEVEKIQIGFVDTPYNTGGKDVKQDIINIIKNL